MQLSINEKLDNYFIQYKNHVYLPGQIILQQSKQISQIYYIKSGLVKQFALSSEGSVFTMQIFKPHSYIPFALYLQGPQNKYTYQAISTTEVMVAPVRDVDLFLQNNPDVLYDLTTRLSQAIAGLLQKIEHTTFDDAYTRILSLLIYFAVQFGEKKEKGIYIALPFTHFDIASCLGIHRETVSRQLIILQKKGFITYDNQRIIIISIAIAQEELEKRCKN